jgi:4'-phosphopantetheinyl transferase
MLALSPHDIHLYFVFFDEIRDDSLLIEYRALLNDEERAQELRFHFAHDRHRYLVTRAAVRTVLSRYSTVPPQQWRFRVNAYGRPEIGNDDPATRGISFNLSHTRSLIVLGITRDHALGVDTENIRTRPAPVEVANSHFSPAEAAALLALPKRMQHERFFHYWTLKEAYIKARGMGLSIPLDQFSFRFPQDRHLGISFDPRLNDKPSRWRFWQLQVAADYLVAVCVERSGDADQQIVTMEFFPSGGKHPTVYEMLRESTQIR